jgi:hypothetical protein
MYPFERYFSTLLPYSKDITAFKACPQIRPFQQDAFLLFLQETSIQVPVRNSCQKDWPNLYK